MQIRRPFLWIAGAVVLGEICRIRELSDALRTSALFGFVLMELMLPWGGSKGSAKGFLRKTGDGCASGGRGGLDEEPLPFFLLLLLMFCLGALRAEIVSASFQTEEAQAFFSRWTLRNEGAFDYALYLKGMGVSSEASYAQFRAGGLLSSGGPYFRLLGDLRQRCAETLSAVLSEKDAGIFGALLLGDKSALPETVQSLYQSQGIAHLLAVSGLHLSIIGMGFYRVLRKCGAGLWLSVPLSSVLVLSYGFLTGAQGSAMRAALMLLVHFLAFHTGKSYDTLSALSFSAVLLLLWRPYLLLGSGFQLSFGAILAISLFGESVIHRVETLRMRCLNARDTAGAKRVQRGTERYGKRIAQEARLPGPARAWITSLSIQFFTLPVILYHFYVLPPYGIFLNFIVIPLMSFVMGSGLLALLWGLLGFRLIAGGFGGAGHYILAFYEWLCRLTSDLPASSLVIGRPGTARVFLYYGAMLLLFFLCFGKRSSRVSPGKRCVLYFLMLGVSAAVLFSHPGPQTLQVTAIDVGQGDGFLLRYRDSSILVDSGSSSEKELGKYTLRPFLQSQGIGSLDAVFVSHADLDHTNGISYLLEEMPELRIARLVLPKAALQEREAYQPLCDAYRDAHPDGSIQYLSENDCFFLSPKGKDTKAAGPRLRCIYEGRGDTAALNAHSPVMLLEYGAFSMLFTGDTIREDEALLARKIRNGEVLLPTNRLTVLKAAHHGSRTSSSDAVLKLFEPAYALLSYGAHNSYGHPHREVTERLARYGTRLLETGKSGEICLRTDGRRLWLNTPFRTEAEGRTEEKTAPGKAEAEETGNLRCSGKQAGTVDTNRDSAL